MAIADVEVSGFSGQYSRNNGLQKIPINKLDIARGIITVGAEDLLDWLSMVGFAVPIRVGGAVQALLSLEETNNRICIRPQYSDLERSEQQATSFWIGLGFAKILGEKILRIPWLAYADRMCKRGVLTYQAGNRKRADLVGLDVHQKWHAIEAKGGKKVFSKKKYAKDQAAGIASIYGLAPDTASACLTYLEPGKPVSVKIVDPEMPEKQPRTPNSERFIKEYYSPLLQSIREHGEERIGDFVYAKSEVAFSYFSPFLTPKEQVEHYRIGVYNKIYDNPLSAMHIAPSVFEGRYKENSGPMSSVGLDGIIVKIIS